jgi:thymidylate synthase
MLSNIIKEKYDHEEKQYLSIIKDLISSGDKIMGRNGYTYSKNGASMYFSLENDTIPILTTKKMATRTCIKELLWFISGKTDNNILNEQNVHIWDGNASPDYIKSRNLNYEEGDLGPIYGHQWRHFNAEYKDCNTDYKNKGVDQLNNLIKMLKDPDEKYSRRLILSAWNPCQLEEMALPPCHILMQFNVSSNDELSCSMYQRSADMGLGVPFNILSYSLLTVLIAKHCGLKPKEFIHHIGNAHIYDDHIDKLNIQVERTPYLFPKIKIKQKHENIEDYKLEDIEIYNYKCHENIILNMRK